MWSEINEEIFAKQLCTCMSLSMSTVHMNENKCILLVTVSAAVEQEDHCVGWREHVGLFRQAPTNIIKVGLLWDSLG